MRMIFPAIAMLAFSPAWADELTDAYQRGPDYSRGYNEGWMDKALGLPTAPYPGRSQPFQNGYDDGVIDEPNLGHSPPSPNP